MIPLYCIVDRKQIPEERVRRGAKMCDKECQKVFRRAFLLDRKERYRKAAGLPPAVKSTRGQRNSVPGGIHNEVTGEDTASCTGVSELSLDLISAQSN
jgi:hypothetical protein